MARSRLSRREAVTLIGTAAATAALGSAARASGDAKAAAPGAVRTPWRYEALDPDAVAERAFAAYHKGHCMYGSFEGIVGTLGDRLGEPYRSFPYDMFVYGAGGINGWGTVCGSLNGSAAAIQLLSAKPEPVIDALFAWYEREALPDYHPKAAKYPDVKVAVGSPLCHVSVSRWCAAARKASYSAERKERCGVLTASVARHAVALLNAQAAGKPVLPVLDKKTQECMACHEEKGAVENTRAKMGCNQCHFVLGGKHKDV